MKNISASVGLERIKEIVDFRKEGTVYLLLAIARKKFNPLTKGQEIVFREIISERNLENKYEKLTTLANNYSDVKGNKFKFYIYLTVNPRNLIKTFSSFGSTFSKWMLELFYSKTEFFNKISRLDSYWYSELMKPENKAGKIFLLDIDSKREEVIRQVESEIERLKINVINRYETLHGFHYLTEPFNRTLFKVNSVEVKTDANIFIEAINFENSKETVKNG